MSEPFILRWLLMGMRIPDDAKWEVIRMMTAPGQLRVGWRDPSGELHVRWIMVDKRDRWGHRGRS
jgi:hypothetical protein